MSALYAPDEFADLDAIIVEDEQRRSDKAAARNGRARLTKGGLSDDERRRLEAELNCYDLAHSWRVVANIALFHTQRCISCGSTHRFFMGWFTQQDHRTDPHSRRLTAGKSTEALPERIEAHSQGDAEMCSDCAETCLIINVAIKD